MFLPAFCNYSVQKCCFSLVSKLNCFGAIVICIKTSRFHCSTLVFLHKHSPDCGVLYVAPQEARPSATTMFVRLWLWCHCYRISQGAYYFTIRKHEICISLRDLTGASVGVSVWFQSILAILNKIARGTYFGMIKLLFCCMWWLSLCVSNILNIWTRLMCLETEAFPCDPLRTSIRLFWKL